MKHYSTRSRPELRPILKKWLKAGIMDQGVFQETEQGTPQGGVISPLLANIALHGLEEDTKEALLASLKKAEKPSTTGGTRELKKRFKSSATPMISWLCTKI